MLASTQGRRTDVGNGVRFTSRDCGIKNNGVKNGNDWFGAGKDCSLQRKASSRSSARKAASAQIAKIPFPLANWIARCFLPRTGNYYTAGTPADTGTCGGCASSVPATRT